MRWREQWLRPVPRQPPRCPERVVAGDTVGRLVPPGAKKPGDIPESCDGCLEPCLTMLGPVEWPRHQLFGYEELTEAGWSL